MRSFTKTIEIFNCVKIKSIKTEALLVEMVKLIANKYIFITIANSKHFAGAEEQRL